MSSRHAPGVVGRAKRLRRAMTYVEKKLWDELRRLDIHLRRQAPIGRFVVDFVVHQAALVIELDGGIHMLPGVQLRDLERTAWLEGQGYRVLCFTNDEVLGDPSAVLAKVEVALRDIEANRGHAPRSPSTTLTLPGEAE